MSAASELEWLCRTEKNEILGPFTIEDVRSRILGRQLGSNDEICKSASYWFMVKEADEVKTFLGIDPPQEERVFPEGATLAITRTNIQTLEADHIKASQLKSVASEKRASEKKPSEIPQISARPKRVPVQPSSGLGGVFWLKWIAFILGFILIVVVARVYVMARN